MKRKSVLPTPNPELEDSATSARFRKPMTGGGTEVAGESRNLKVQPPHILKLSQANYSKRLAGSLLQLF